MDGQLARSDLLRIGDEGLAEFVRHTARHGHNTTIEERDGILLVSGSHPAPGPYRNFAMRQGPGLSAETFVARADAFFKAKRRSYVLWVRMHADDDLEALAVEREWMRLEQDGLIELWMDHPPANVDPPEGVTVLRVDGDIMRRDFLRVNAASWGMAGISDEDAAAMFFEPSSLDAPNIAAILAYQDERPVASAMAIVYRGAVGGYWGATIPEARKQGLGDVVVRTMFRAGFDLGAKVAVFQASGMGEQIWRRMGADDFTRYARYLITP
jgi:Acetyltransferase (GNAT) domain